MRSVWAIVVGTFGLLDMLATLLPGMMKSGTCASAETQQQAKMTCSPPSFPSVLLVEWIKNYNIAVSFTFSLVWFIDALFKARNARQQVLREKERQRVLAMEGSETVLAKPADTKPKWWKSATFVYYKSIMLQILCLPIGFYVLLFAKNIDSAGFVHYQDFSVDSKKAFVVAALQYFNGVASSRVAMAIQRLVKVIIPRVLKSIGNSALRHPLKFRRQMIMVLSWVRFLKYGFPLVGKFNKFLGLVKLSLKRQKQRIEKKKLKRSRRLITGSLRKSKPKKVQEKDAAIMIQNAFRALQKRKAKKALALFQSKTQDIAVAKIQNMLRRKIKSRRAALRKKRDELEKLKLTYAEKDLSDNEKRRMYELQDELVQEANNLFNRKMLIRPNTKFVVYFKVFFTFCIFWEIFHISAQPFLPKNLTMGELVAQKLVPTRISDLPQCNIRSGIAGSGMLRSFSKNRHEMKGLPWYCHDPYSTFQEIFRDIIALMLIPSPISEWPECQDTSKGILQGLRKQENMQPAVQGHWYCSKNHQVGHRLFHQIDGFIVGTFSFFDVFVTFFTGEFHPDNGVLIPKPFFTRWILPGVCLQLLVNPHFKQVSTRVFSGIEKLLRNGPIRVYRWNAATLYPLSYLVVNIFVTKFWFKIVKFENHNRLFPREEL